MGSEISIYESDCEGLHLSMHLEGLGCNGCTRARRVDREMISGCQQSDNNGELVAAKSRKSVIGFTRQSPCMEL